VVLYNAAGALLFSGGITAARGHEGDNAGREMVLAHLAANDAGRRAPVFGCPLFADGECEACKGNPCPR
jgi:hypothetical protein